MLFRCMILLTLCVSLMLSSGCATGKPTVHTVEVAVPTVVEMHAPPITFDRMWKQSEPKFQMGESFHLCSPANVEIVGAKILFLREQIMLRDAWIDAVLKLFDATKKAK